MRSRFADKTEEIVPRSLKQLLNGDDQHAQENARRRRPRKTRALRKAA